MVDRDYRDTVRLIVVTLTDVPVDIHSIIILLYRRMKYASCPYVMVSFAIITLPIIVLTKLNY